MLSEHLLIYSWMQHTQCHLGEQLVGISSRHLYELPMTCSLQALIRTPQVIYAVLIRENQAVVVDVATAVRACSVAGSLAGRVVDRIEMPLGSSELGRAAS